MSSKRLFDLAMTVPALPVVVPITLGLAAAVRLTSRGPAFFVQERIGRGKRAIRVAKLRTMVADAERQGPHVTASRDPRITPLGRLLRRAKLDELPQLYNVLRGEMSLVGPRPEAPRYLDAFLPAYEGVFEVCPGITDPASIAFRDEEALLARARDPERAYREVIVPVKARLQLEGIEASSVAHDVQIIARTLGRLVGLGGTEHPVIRECREGIEQMNREIDEASP